MMLQEMLQTILALACLAILTLGLLSVKNYLRARF